MKPPNNAPLFNLPKGRPDILCGMENKIAKNRLNHAA